jgi:hypothetical protein
MKLAVLVLLAACRASGGGGGGGGGDAGTGDGGGGEAGIELKGRVCIPIDLRAPTVCDDTKDASGLTVTLGAGTAVGTVTTQDKTGEFTIFAPLGTGFTWHVTGSKIVTSAMPFGTDNTIPVLGDTQYIELQVGNSVLVQDQQGSIFVRVVDGTVPVANLKASSDPPANNLAFYDGATSTDWDQDQTDELGVVWFPGVPVAPAPAKLTLSPPGAAAVPLSVTVEDQVITFVTKDLH